jgi:hypothetical protein
MCRIARWGRPDEGSVLLALFAIMVVGSLAFLLAATVIHLSVQTQHHQGFTVAGQGADAGLQQAAFMFSSGQGLPTVPTTPRDLGGAQVSWFSTNVAPLDWVIRSTGRVGGVSRTVTAHLVQDRAFTAAAFGDKGITFLGANTAVSYPTTGQGVLASNGSLILKNNTFADGAVLFDWSANPDASRCQNGPCTTSQTHVDAPFDLKSSVTPGGFITTHLNLCKAATSPLPPFQGTSINLDVASRVLVDGQGQRFICYSSFKANTQNGVFSVTNTNGVKIYVEGDASLGDKSGSDVNYDPVDPPGPDARRLQIFSAGASVLMYNQGHVAAAVYAPNATCGGATSNAGLAFYGSLVCDLISNVGGWAFHFDTELAGVGNGVTVLQHYAED